MKLSAAFTCGPERSGELGEHGAGGNPNEGLQKAYCIQISPETLRLRLPQKSGIFCIVRRLRDGLTSRARRIT